LNNVLESLLKSVNDGNIAVMIPVAVAAVALFRFKKIVEFIDGRKKVRITKLNEALSCEFVDEFTQKHLQQELAKEHCKLTTGIGVERQFREEIFKIHRNMNGEISVNHFKRALPHFKFEKQKVSIHIDKFERTAYWFHLLGGYLMAFMSLAILLLLAQIPNPAVVTIFTTLGISVSFAAVAILMAVQTLPIVSAKMIGEKIKSL